MKTIGDCHAAVHALGTPRIAVGLLSPGWTGLTFRRTSGSERGLTRASPVEAMTRKSSGLRTSSKRVTHEILMLRPRYGLPLIPRFRSLLHRRRHPPAMRQSSRGAPSPPLRRYDQISGTFLFRCRYRRKSTVSCVFVVRTHSSAIEITTVHLDNAGLSCQGILELDCHHAILLFLHCQTRLKRGDSRHRARHW